MATLNSSFLRKVIFKIRNLVRRPPASPPEEARRGAILPADGHAVSVETALNSRCTSDDDGQPRVFHWGMFDTDSKLTHEQIELVLSSASIPRLTNGLVKVTADSNLLTFTIDNRAAGRLKDLMMVESGMQQQAVGLVCAALGVGNVFSGLGPEGKALSADEFATVRMRIDAMRPSYAGSYWTSAAPSGPRPWRPGNLPDPARRGGRPLIAVLADCRPERRDGRKASAADVGQLLWAARGRTPHFYKFQPWGLTIPTNRGEQGLTSVHVLEGNRLSRYVNWKRRRPTHSLEAAGSAGGPAQKEMDDRFGPGQSCVILSRNETSGRALWEIGCQLLNLVVQATSLGLSYEAALLEEGSALRCAAVPNPVAVLVFKGEG